MAANDRRVSLARRAGLCCVFFPSLVSCWFAELSLGQVRRALRRQALCDFQALDAVHPGKMLRDGAGLVALDWTDVVPLEWQLRQCADLFHPFLHVVLAERALPGGVCRQYGRRRESLADRQQLHTGGGTASVGTGRNDAQAYRFEVLLHGRGQRHGNLLSVKIEARTSLKGPARRRHIEEDGEL